MLSVEIFTLMSRRLVGLKGDVELVEQGLTAALACSIKRRYEHTFGMLA